MGTTCPRCGGKLERYELWGHEQSSCGDCGYVGVPVDHVSDRDPPESWGDAIRRFQDSEVPGPTERRGGPTTVPEAPEDPDASPTVEVVPGSPAVPEDSTPDDAGEGSGESDPSEAESDADGAGGDAPAPDDPDQSGDEDSSEPSEAEPTGDGREARRRKKKRER